MKSETVQYQDGGVNLAGYLAWDETIEGQRPAVLVVHDWTGRNEFACQKAEKLAELGYVGFAVDMYGNGALGQNNEEKTQLMTPFMDDRQLLSKRIYAAYEATKILPQVDATKMAAIGFCFGGLCALDLARGGAELSGVVSFHGGLNKPEHTSASDISAKILVLHGHDDPVVPPQQVTDFANEMSAANVDWQVHVYGNTLHSFTNPQANDRDFGTVYNATADQRSWQAMKNFFAEVF